MITLRYNKTDLRYVFVLSDNSKELQALEKHLNKIPSYMFLPSFLGIPKPEVFLHKIVKDGKILHYVHSGLWKEIVDWCNNNGIQVDGCLNDSHFKYRDEDLNEEEFKLWVNSLGLNVQPRPYQIHAAYLIVKYRLSTSQLATRSGKTLIAYMVFRWMLEHGAHNILMIVPNISLVRQGVADMDDYGKFFQSETVWAKSEFCEGSNLTIGTFQSVVKRADKNDKKYDPKWLKKFDVVCIDECHTAKCKSIQTILNNDFMKNVKLKFGFTGTLPDDSTIESYCVQSLLGPKIQDITSKELQDAGYIANADIKQIHIKYDFNDELISLYEKCGEYLVSNYILDEDKKKILLPMKERDLTIQHKKSLPFSVKEYKKHSTKEEYIDYLIDLCKANGSQLLMLEEMIIHRLLKRLKVIDNIIDEVDGNVVVFGHHVEYIKKMNEHIESNHPDKIVLVITGATSPKKRKEYQDKMLECSNVVLIASYACVGTGLTFKNLDYGIFAQSFKSGIINKQAIGRGLLRAESKDTFYLYDLVDELPTNRLKKQGLDKAKLWRKEGFTFHSMDV